MCVVLMKFSIFTVAVTSGRDIVISGRVLALTNVLFCTCFGLEQEFMSKGIEYVISYFISILYVLVMIFIYWKKTRKSF